MLSLERILGLAEQTVEIFGKVESSFISRQEKGFSSLAELESFRSLTRKSQEVFRLYHNCYASRANWQAPTDSHMIIATSKILGIYLTLTKEKIEKLVQEREKLGLYPPCLISRELYSSLEELQEIPRAILALEKTAIFTKKQMRNLLEGIDRFPLAIEHFETVTIVMRNAFLELSKYSDEDKAELRRLQTRINKVAIEGYRDQIWALKVFKKYHAAYLRDDLWVNCTSFPLIAVHPLSKKIVQDASYKRLQEQTGGEIGSGSFGKVNHLQIAGKSLVVKSSIDGEFDLEIIKGAHCVRQLYNKKYFIEVPFIMRNSIVMEKAHFPLYRMIRDYTRHLQRFTVGYFQDLIKAFFVLHENGYTHGDVSFTNLLFVDDEQEKGLDRRAVTIKLADFDSVAIEKAPRQLGTYTLQPPELVSDKEKLKRPTFEANTWSLGVLLYGILAKRFGILDIPPKDTASPRKVYAAISALTQETIDHKIDQLGEDDELIASLGNEFMELQLMQLGKADAHLIFIEKGRAELVKPLIRRHLVEKKIPDDVFDTRFRQYLLNLGLNAEFNAKKTRYELRDRFIKFGFKHYVDQYSRAHFDAEVVRLGKEIFSTLKDLLKGLLKINPSERLTVKEAYELFISPLELQADENLDGIRSLSLEEVDHL